MTRGNMSIPQQKIEIGSIDVSADCVASTVWRPENAVSRAQIVLKDKNAVHFDGNVDEFDVLKISYKYANQSSYTQVFEGLTEDPTATLQLQNKVTAVLAYGYGRALLKTHCATDFGIESANTTIFNPEDVWDDLVDNRINKNFDGNTTGWELTKTKIKAVTNPSINFIKGDYRNNFDILNQTCLLHQADQAGSAGVHWFVDPSKNLWIDTIASHSVDTTNWPTYWRTDAAGSTLVEGRDFTDYTFKIHTKDFANKIILISNLRKPGYDYWTEDSGGAALWSKNSLLSSISDNAVTYVVGSHSLDIAGANGTQGRCMFPSSSLSGDAAAAQKDVAVTTATNFKVGDVVCLWDNSGGPNTEDATIASIAGTTLTMVGNLTNAYAVADNAVCTKKLQWDLSKFGSPKNPPTLNFYYYNDSNLTVANTRVLLMTTPYYAGADYYTTKFCNNNTVSNWHHFSVPIGPYYQNALAETDEPRWSKQGNGDWADINSICFWAQGTGAVGHVYIDDLHVAGKIVREAYNSTSITAVDEWQKVIKLEVAVDDMCLASDDSGTAAQLAYAELLHAQTIPTVGTVTIAGAQDILPGQLVHVHAHKQLSGSYRVDANMRVKQAVHKFTRQGFVTDLELTSDVVNSFAVGPNNQLSELARVQYVDPEAKSLKSTGVDALVTRLSVDYP